jgi:hypothetical protein
MGTVNRRALLGAVAAGVLGVATLSGSAQATAHTPATKPAAPTAHTARVSPVVSESAHVHVKNAKGEDVEKFSIKHANGKTVEYEVKSIPAEGKNTGVTAPVKAKTATSPSVAAVPTAIGTQYWGMAVTGTVTEDPDWAGGAIYHSSLSFAYDMERVAYSDGSHRDYFRVHNGPYSIIYRTTYPQSFTELRYIVEMYDWANYTNYADGYCSGDFTIDCWANGNTSRIFNVAEGVSGIKNGTLGTNKYWPMSGFGASLFRTSVPRIKTGPRNEINWVFSPCQGYSCPTKGTAADVADTFFIWNSNKMPG